MELVVFDNVVLQKHSLYSSCSNTLQNVSNRDYPNKYSFNQNIECLDVDTYEKTIHAGSFNNTMDAVIGVCTARNDKTKVSPRLLLVELRMDYESTNNLSSSEMNKKVSYTRTLLGAEINIEQTHLFIYDKCISEQVKRWFNNKTKEGRIPPSYEACSVEDFAKIVVPIDSLPYVPKHNPNKILEKAQLAMGTNDWNSLWKLLRYWIEQTKSYKFKDKFEFENLINILSLIWDQFKQINVTLSEDDELEALIINDDLTSIKN